MARRFSTFSTLNAENKLELYDPEIIAGSVAYYSFDGHGNDSGPNGINLTHAGVLVYEEAYGIGLPPPGGDTTGARQCWSAKNVNLDRWIGPTGSAGDALRLTGSMTCQAWVYYPLTKAAAIVVQGQTISGTPPDDNSIYIFQTTSGDKLLYGHEDAGGVFLSITTSTAAAGLAKQAWNHVAFTRDAAGTGIYIYLNGTTIHSGTLSDPPAGGANGEFEVGAYNNASRWLGGVTGVLIEDVVRTKEEIAANYRRGALGY